MRSISGLRTVFTSESEYRRPEKTKTATISFLIRRCVTFFLRNCLARDPDTGDPTPVEEFFTLQKSFSRF